MLREKMGGDRNESRDRREKSGDRGELSVGIGWVNRGFLLIDNNSRTAAKRIN